MFCHLVAQIGEMFIIALSRNTMYIKKKEDIEWKRNMMLS